MNPVIYPIVAFGALFFALTLACACAFCVYPQPIKRGGFR